VIDEPAAEPDVQDLLARYVEEHLAGQAPDVDGLCAEHPHLRARLRGLVVAYHAIDGALSASPEESAVQQAAALPHIEGFRTIERLGRGGAGDVYKLEDVTLGRVVAAKVLRPNSPLATSLPDFLREARSLALFEDPHIVGLLDFRKGDPPVLLMEHVDGFTLAEIGPSLAYAQKARLVADIASALHRAHTLGLQHRDIKPANVMVDARLQPKILDFGLSGADPHAGHGRGTLAYMSPEQLDRSRPIDARTDVYALGVVLYELLCGVRPYDGAEEALVLTQIREGQPRLPVEIEGSVPEPLQAIALKAMAASPAERYVSAHEMAVDLGRYLGGRPVLARPPLYRVVLERRIEPHLEQVAEWERLRLIYPHESDRLRDSYRRLRAREDDWIVQGRMLSLPQIALYLGAFLLLCSSVLAFLAHLKGSVHGVAWPLAALGAPCLLLHVAAHRLYRGPHKAAAVAFYLGAAVLIPSMLLISFQEMGWWVARAGNDLELFTNVSNRQLQVAAIASCLWAAWLAGRTRTVALSSGFTFLLAISHLALIADIGLRRWLEDGAWDQLSIHLLPLLALAAIVGAWSETRGRPWLAEPLYVTSAGLYIVVLELFALNGRALAHLGVTLASTASAPVSDATLLDTVAAMTSNGLLIYTAGWTLERHGTALLRQIASLLYVATPFALLEPLAYLDHTGEYSRRFDWMYLCLALAVAFASRLRQRRSFYYAGLLNTGVALALITDHHHWVDRPGWTVAVMLAGVTTLGIGLAASFLRVRR
jgi:serine/threonine protein kinase